MKTIAHIKAFIGVALHLLALPISVWGQISTSIVVVTSPSVAPQKIINLNPHDTLCLGGSTTLTLQGGMLGGGAQWVWYQDSCLTGSVIGTGDTIHIIPEGTHTYFCTAMGGCNTPACVDKFIYVDMQEGCIPLPLHLLGFSVRLSGQHTAVLDWQTAGAINTGYFEVEKSADAVAFQYIATLNVRKEDTPVYFFADSLLYNGYNYYRLKVIDLDGSYTYSPVRYVYNRCAEIITANLYPNPADNQLYFDYQLDDPNEINVWITDLLGRNVIQMQQLKGKKGHNIAKFPIEGIPDGTYLFIYNTVHNASARNRAVKFVKKAG